VSERELGGIEREGGGKIKRVKEGNNVEDSVGVREGEWGRWVEWGGRERGIWI
jgi:hypothetical protein